MTTVGRTGTVDTEIVEIPPAYRRSDLIGAARGRGPDGPGGGGG